MDAVNAIESQKGLESSLVPVQQRIIAWDENGQPNLVVQPVLTKQHLQSIYFIVAAQPFICDDPLDPDFAKYDGLTVAEVLVRKQLMNAAKSGDVDQIEKAMDRLIGKSMSRGENIQIHASYEDTLKRIEAKIRGEVVDVTPEESTETGIFGDLA